MKTKTPVIFFDGFCNLCNGAVQFTIDRDPKAIFKFSSLQSEYAKETLTLFNIHPQQRESMVLLEDGRVYERSTAALRVARKLSGLWPLLYVFIILPRFMRDGIYNYVGKNRYKWFGRQDSCWIPTPELKDRFL